MQAVPQGNLAGGAGSTTPVAGAKKAVGVVSSTSSTGSTSPDTGSSSPSTGSTTSSTGSTTPSTGSTTPDSGSATPGGNGTTSSLKAAASPATTDSGGFCNTVFNTGASKMSGWPATTWNTLKSNGVDDWIGFAWSTLDETDTYNTAAGPAKTTPDLNAHQIHVVMDGRYVNYSINLLKTNPPQYLELYNEPDYSFQGVTPKTDPVPAANELATLLATPHPQTTFISPALADATSDWLDQFFAACNGCLDQIPIIAQHIYNPNVQGVMDKINSLHNKPGMSTKDIWITELSPASGDCTLSQDGVIDWMNTLIGRIHQEAPFVKKIFWNCGEHGGGGDGLAGGTCNPSLTNDDGSATPVLDAYNKVCGGGS